MAVFFFYPFVKECVSPCFADKYMKMVCVLSDLILTVFQTLLSGWLLPAEERATFPVLTTVSLLSFSPVIKTRLQSLQRGVNEDTYSGILDCTK